MSPLGCSGGPQASTTSVALIVRAVRFTTPDGAIHVHLKRNKLSVDMVQQECLMIQLKKMNVTKTKVCYRSFNN